MTWSLNRDTDRATCLGRRRNLTHVFGRTDTVRVHASGVNPLDTKIRAGKAAHAEQPLPAVLGLDMAGVVEEVGPGVTNFRPCDEVYGMVGGVGRLQGTLSEFIVANADLIALKPKSLSMREAAVLPLITITAWEGIVDENESTCGGSDRRRGILASKCLPAGAR